MKNLITQKKLNEIKTIYAKRENILIEDISDADVLIYIEDIKIAFNGDFNLRMDDDGEIKIVGEYKPHSFYDTLEYLTNDNAHISFI